MNTKKSRRKSSTVAITKLRLELLIFWAMLFLFYFVLLLLCDFKVGVTFDQSFAAAMRIAYMFVPVIGAFASFWFMPGPNGAAAEERLLVDRVYRTAAFAIQLVLHIIVTLSFAIGVLLPDFELLQADHAVGFTDRVENVIQILFLVWSVSLLPVGWILRQAMNKTGLDAETIRQ